MRRFVREQSFLKDFYFSNKNLAKKLSDLEEHVLSVARNSGTAITFMVGVASSDFEMVRYCVGEFDSSAPFRFQFQRPAEDAAGADPLASLDASGPSRKPKFVFEIADPSTVLSRQLLGNPKKTQQIQTLAQSVEKQGSTDGLVIRILVSIPYRNSSDQSAFYESTGSGLSAWLSKLQGGSTRTENVPSEEDLAVRELQRGLVCYKDSENDAAAGPVAGSGKGGKGKSSRRTFRSFYEMNTYPHLKQFGNSFRNGTAPSKVVAMTQASR